MEIVGRIKRVIELKSESINSLSKLLNLPQTSVNQWMTGGRRMPLDFVSGILDLYPDLSAEWLLRGKGDMFLLPELPKEEEKPNTDMGMAYFEQLMERMKKEMKEEIIAELKNIG